MEAKHCQEALSKQKWRSAVTRASLFRRSTDYVYKEPAQPQSPLGSPSSWRTYFSIWLLFCKAKQENKSSTLPKLKRSLQTLGRGCPVWKLWKCGIYMSVNIIIVFCVHVSAHVQRPGSTLVSFFKRCPPWILSLSLSWNSSIRLGWLAGGPQESSCLCPSVQRL